MNYGNQLINEDFEYILAFSKHEQESLKLFLCLDPKLLGQICCQLDLLLLRFLLMDLVPTFNKVIVDILLDLKQTFLKGDVFFNFELS